jgi:hypothetical protein
MSGRLIRLNRGMWGLIDRDLTLPTDRLANLLAHLYSALDAHGKAMHVSRVESELMERCGTPEDPTHYRQLFFLAQRDSRFLTGRGDTIALAKWNAVRGMSVRTAMQQIRTEWRGPIKSDQLMARVEALVGRPVPKTTILQHTTKSGFQYDHNAGHYRLLSPATP